MPYSFSHFSSRIFCLQLQSSSLLIFPESFVRMLPVQQTVFTIDLTANSLIHKTIIHHLRYIPYYLHGKCVKYSICSYKPGQNKNKTYTNTSPVMSHLSQWQNLTTVDAGSDPKVDFKKWGKNYQKMSP